MNWKLRGYCFACRRKRWFVARRGVFIKQLNQSATPRELMCGSCVKRLQALINLTNHG